MMAFAYTGSHSATGEPDDAFLAAVTTGLSRPQKSLPCRYLYDARGSDLFEAITKLPEYYPSRTERHILESNAGDVALRVPPASVLVEFGSGSSRKTEILLAALHRIAAYVAIDVSESALLEAKARLGLRFPRLDVRTIVADFSSLVKMPRSIAARKKTGFFPGSTVGNLTHGEAIRLLAHFRKMLGRSGRLVVGVDLKKDVGRLIAAYDDAAGVTAAFNLNLLRRINRELDGNFDLSRFRHEARYEIAEGRIEMHLVSLANQSVRIGDKTFAFAEGETIHTESSYKYTVEEFQGLAQRAGWRPVRVWTDSAGLFSVHELE